MAGGAQAAARRALEAGLVHNADARPARASASFRAALRRLGPAGDHEPGDHDGQGAAYVRARALLGLVVSDFELRADIDASTATLDEAQRWARHAGDRAVEVLIQAQRGVLLMRAGEDRAALRALDQAVGRLDDADPVDACRLLLNRGCLHLELGDRESARPDLERSAARAEALGLPSLLFKARHNLGYLEFLTGDLPAALAAMSDAAEISHTASPAVALLDRAQVLLEAGLTTEADAHLGRAAELFATHRLPHELAKTELSRASCALVAGRPRDAVRWATSARRRFARRGNEAWLARADLALCRADLAVLLDGDASVSSLLRVAAGAEGLADRASGHGGVVGKEVARAARVTAAQALVAAGRTGPGAAALAAAGRLTGREPLPFALQMLAVKAQLGVLAGRPDAARRHVRAGQAMLAEHRSRLGSVEAVTAAAVHGERLTAIDVEMALGGGDAQRVLDAVERGRATTAGPARVRAPQDVVLADLLARLRQQLERGRLLEPGAGLAQEREVVRREVVLLRQEARERWWRLGDGARAPKPMPARSVVRAVRSSASHGLVLADYLVHQGTVSVVVVDRAGARLHHLAPVAEVEELARRLRADLRVLADPFLPGPMRDAVRRSLSRGLDKLDDRLLAPVRGVGPLHVVAGGALLTLPWGMVATRAGLATSVSNRLYTHPAGAGRSSRSVVAVAGPGLAHAEAEARAVGRVWPSARTLAGEDARCAAAVDALVTADVVHIAAHGRHESDNPLFSWVRLADGPLFAHELEGSLVPGTTVVLSACEVGQGSVRPGGEVLGLASVLLRLGASAVIASLAPLRDDVATEVMPALHRRLRRGESPAAALAAVCSHVEEPVPLTCFAPVPLDGLSTASPRSTVRSRTIYAPPHPL